MAHDLIIDGELVLYGPVGGDWWDDTGFTADGVFVSEHVLHHGGMVLRREAPGAGTAAPREAR